MANVEIGNAHAITNAEKPEKPCFPLTDKIIDRTYVDSQCNEVDTVTFHTNNKKINQLESTNDELKIQYDELKNQYDELKNQYEELNMKINTIKYNNFNSLNNENETERIKEITSYIQDLNDKSLELIRKKTQIQKEIASNTAKIQELKKLTYSEFAKSFSGDEIVNIYLKEELSVYKRL